MKKLMALNLMLLVAGCSHSLKKERNEVISTVKTAIPQIKECYSSGLKENPALKGKLVSHFLIDDRGKVTKCESKKSELNNAAVENCVCNKISSLQFAGAPSGHLIDINYPIVFEKTVK